jgi:2-keto-4-pentenoate hydratase
MAVASWGRKVRLTSPAVQKQLGVDHDLPDLTEVTMSMTENGKAVSQGVGSACLGGPWEALAWLANTCRAVGAGLTAGEVVLSGALGPMVAVTAGSTYTAAITGIGVIESTFTTGAKL